MPLCELACKVLERLCVCSCASNESQACGRSKKLIKVAKRRKIENEEKKK